MITFDDIKGWFFVFFYIFCILFLFFGRDIYDAFFKKSNLDIYREAYIQTYGVEPVISGDLKIILSK